MKLNMRRSMLIAFLIILATTTAIAFIPVKVAVPQIVNELYIENYTVTEPREVRVSDYVDTNKSKIVSYEDTKYVSSDLISSANLNSCNLNYKFKQAKFAYTTLGKFNTYSYGGNNYFVGYLAHASILNPETNRISYGSGGTIDVVVKEIDTFNVDTKVGGIYEILLNDIENRSAPEGGYISLKDGYNIQINKIGNASRSSTYCPTGHYVPPEDSDSTDTGYECTSTTTTGHGATITLNENSIKRQSFDIFPDEMVTYSTQVETGETIPTIILHVQNVTDSDVIFDSAFQISKHKVQTGGLGSELSASITNIDTQSGTFGVYMGFHIYSTVDAYNNVTQETEQRVVENYDVGTTKDVFLNPSNSSTFYFSSDKKNITDCKYYGYSMFGKTVSEKFINTTNVTYVKKLTIFRNVTLFVDVTKTRIAFHNVTKIQYKTVPFYQTILQKNMS